MKTCTSLLAIFLLSSCNLFQCDTKGWIEEAPQALQEFELVRQELEDNPTFVDEFSRNESLFLRKIDSIEYQDYPVPKVREWFRNGRGYIDFQENSISFCYKQCIKGGRTANAYFYSIPQRHQHSYKSGVEIVDSLTIGNEWRVHIVTCNGCLE